MKHGRTRIDGSQSLARGGARRARIAGWLMSGVALALGGCAEDRAPLGSADEALTAEQCSFFADGDFVQICHHTSSTRKPYTIIRTNLASCGGHADHDGDYVTSSDPADPRYDPTCSGQGCFPEGAPFDGSVECCEGLAPEGGVCADIDECATDNGGCGAGYDCTNNAGAPPTCSDIDECATNNGGCAADQTCSNQAGAPPTCAPSPDLIANGSFEDGTFEPVVDGAYVLLVPGDTRLTGWSVGNASGNKAGWHNTSNFRPMQDGGRAIDLVDGGRCYTPGAAASVVSQVVATVPGATYRLALHIAAPTDGVPCSSPSTGTSTPRTITAHAGSIRQAFSVAASSAGSMVWSRKELTFVATATTTTIAFSVNTVDNGYWGPVLDAVSLVRLAQ